MDFDVAVVGAGPSGSTSAEALSLAGFSVVLIEEHGEIGYPVHCSGLVTPRTLEVAGVDESVVSNRIRGTIIHTPKGNQISVGGDKVYALVIDRARFDQILVNRAQTNGVTLLTNSRVSKIEQRPGYRRVEFQQSGKKKYLDVHLVIGADGSRSIVARNTQLDSSNEEIIALGGEIDATPIKGDFVEVFVRPDLAPGWFGWIIPGGDNPTRIGLGSSDKKFNPKKLINALTSEYDHLQARRFIRLQGGIIPVSFPRRMHASGILLVGDAAGQTKSTSGGGIYTGIVSARLCAEVAVDALKQGNLEGDALVGYYSIWARELGNELSYGAKLRHLLMQLSADEIEVFLGMFSLKGIQSIVKFEGDIDFPGYLFKQLFRPAPILESLRSLPFKMWPRLFWLLIQWLRISKERKRLLRTHGG
jgi:geranylgeranyl reductase family protein